MLGETSSLEGRIWALGGPCWFLSSDGHASRSPALAGQIGGTVAAGCSSCDMQAEGQPGTRQEVAFPAGLVTREGPGSCFLAKGRANNS